MTTRREMYQVTIRVEDDQDITECTRIEQRTSDDDVMLGLGVALSGAIAGVDSSWISVMRTLASAVSNANEGIGGCPYKDGRPEVDALNNMVDAAYKAVDLLMKKVNQ